MSHFSGTFTLKPLVTLVVIMLALQATAQQHSWSFKQMVDSTLQNNFAIQIAAIDTQITELQNSAGQAGMLPSLGVNAGQTFSVNDVNQEFLNGTSNSRDGAQSQNFNAALQLNYTLFDGFKMFAQKRFLEQQSTQSQIALQLSIEQNISTLAATYFQLLTLQKEEDLLKEMVLVSRERWSTAKNRFEMGRLAGLAAEQARVDFLNDSALLIQNQNEQKRQVIQLNRIMGRVPQANIQLDSLQIPEFSFEWTDLQKQTQTANNTLKSARLTIKMRKEQERIEKSNMYPSLAFTGDYAFSRSQSQAGFLSSSSNIGPQLGLQLNVPLFNGWVNKQNAKITALETQQAEKALQGVEQEIASALFDAFIQYENAEQLLNMEKERVKLAAKNLSVAQEQLNLGVIDNLEFREIQLIYTQAKRSELIRQLEKLNAAITLQLLSGNWKGLQ